MPRSLDAQVSHPMFGTDDDMDVSCGHLVAVELMAVGLIATESRTDD
jgi:hypothetical protein